MTIRIAHELKDLPFYQLGDLLELQGDLKDLTDRNAAKLRRSIAKHGIFVPFFVWPAPDGNNYILDGHQRKRTLVTDGHGALPVPCVLVHADTLQEAKEKLLVISSQYGRINQEGYDEFTFDLPDIGDIVHFDALSFEFGQDEDEEPEQGDAEAQVDRAAELQEQWGTERGQLWAIGEHKLLCGDSTVQADVERVMGGEKAELAPVDPPYNVGFDYDGETVDDTKTAHEYEGFSKSWFELCQLASDKQIVTPGGVNLKKWLSWFDVLHVGAWAKSNDTGGAHGVISAFQCWEPVLFFINQDSRNKRKLAFTSWLRSTSITAAQIDDATRTNMGGHYLSDKSQPAIPTVEMFEKIRHITGNPPSDILKLINNRRDDGFGRTRHSDVFYFDPAVSTKEHPCPKPLKMWTDLIEHYSEPGAVIYESFGGSGTTMVACQNLGRKCRMVEISPAYCAVILQRMADAFPGIDIYKMS